MGWKVEEEVETLFDDAFLVRRKGMSGLFGFDIASGESSLAAHREGRCHAVPCGLIWCGAVRCGAVPCSVVSCDAVRQICTYLLLVHHKNNQYSRNPQPPSLHK